MAILRGLAAEGGLPWQGEEVEAVDMIRCGHRDHWEMLGDMCREVGQRVVDGAFLGGSQCGTLVRDDDLVPTFVPRASSARFLL